MCECKGSYINDTTTKKCTLCSDIDVNSKPDGDGACECKPKHIRDVNDTNKCFQCYHYDTNLLWDGVSDCKCKNGYVKN